MTPRHRPGGLVSSMHALFVISVLWTAFFLAWGSLRTVDFAYPLLYRALDIDTHIAQYGPQNRFKHGFEFTSHSQRLALFGEIVDAIHSSGQGLEQIRYTDGQGRSITLLRQPEVIHLRSVARLIDRLAWVSWGMLAGLLVSLAVLRAGRMPPPRAARVAGWSLGVVVAAIVFTLVYGPEDVFNTLHTWVFPAGEQWFFYYQESLMTTLMKAPDIFAAIAVLWLLLALVYGGIMLAACRYWLWPALTPSRQ